jgi:hypothetical protein
VTCGTYVVKVKGDYATGRVNCVTLKEEIELQLGLQAAPGIPFEQFRLFYESAERVTERRLALNRGNASLAALIAAGLGVVAAWAFEKPHPHALGLAVVAMVSALAAIFCRWWWQQIESYKDLNRAKFEVLAAMAKGVIFVGGSREHRCEFNPFDWEWRIMGANNALASYKGGKALGASWSELTVPKAFLVFFVSVAAVSFGMLCGAIVVG